jgi:hypothetical protein
MEETKMLDKENILDAPIIRLYDTFKTIVSTIVSPIVFINFPAFSWENVDPYRSAVQIKRTPLHKNGGKLLPVVMGN